MATTKGMKIEEGKELNETKSCNFAAYLFLCMLCGVFLIISDVAARNDMIVELGLWDVFFIVSDMAGDGLTIELDKVEPAEVRGYILTTGQLTFKYILGISVSIVKGSPTQVALFVVPFSVLAGWAMDREMDLNFGALNTSVIPLSVCVVLPMVIDGHSN